jgi:hypothetical protein
MKDSADRREALRARLLVVSCIWFALAAVIATHAGSAAAAMKPPTPNRWRAAVALAALSAGDVSYDVVRVRAASHPELEP